MMLKSNMKLISTKYIVLSVQKGLNQAIHMIQYNMMYITHTASSVESSLRTSFPVRQYHALTVPDSPVYYSKCILMQTPSLLH